jgi:DUF1365 family protein
VAVEGGLCVAKVFHKRLRPKVHGFHYSVYYIACSLSKLSNLKSPIFSLNRFNLLSFYDRDHGARDGSALEPWINGVLKSYQVEGVEDIVLMCHPRVLGYVFNPVSFWFCLDKDQKIRAVLAEVNNTFGERHSYFVMHEDGQPIEKNDWLESNKIFYVSPFFEVKGTYRFRFVYGDKQIAAWINYEDEEGTLFTSSLIAKRKKMHISSVLWIFVMMPLVTLKTIALIHFEAARLRIKGVKMVDQPMPPEDEISR